MTILISSAAVQWILLLSLDTITCEYHVINTSTTYSYIAYQLPGIVLILVSRHCRVRLFAYACVSIEEISLISDFRTVRTINLPFLHLPLPECFQCRAQAR